jgi:hypothetical protein
MMSHVFCTCPVPHHGNCEGWWSDLFNKSHLRVWSLTCFIRVLSVWSHTKDDMLYSRWTCHCLRCRHVYHMCAFRMSNMRGKDTLKGSRQNGLEGGWIGLHTEFKLFLRKNTVRLRNLRDYSRNLRTRQPPRINSELPTTVRTEHK